MKIKQKIIAGTLSIVTVLGFGMQLPVSATGNRPGVFQEQFFPDEHNTADELWARAERTNTAEDWEAAAEACDKAHKAYEKSGNMEMAREFFANTYKAAAKSSQKVAEKISYSLSSFSAEEIEKKRDQAINNWNLAAECYEEAARLFRNTEARDDEDKICEKLAKEVRANADFDTALAAWEKANKVNTVESWNNAGQLFDQAAQSCRDAGFIEKSSSCDNKSREAFKKIESIKKSSIDTDLEEDTNVANQTEQVVVENEKVDETSEEAFLKQVENIITEVKNRSLNSKEVTDIAVPNDDKSLDYIIQIRLMNNIKSTKQTRAYAALKKAQEQPTIENWNEVGKVYEELAEDYKEADNENEANRCIAEAKRVYIRADWEKAKKQLTNEKMNEFAKRYEELAKDYKRAGDEKEVNICILKSKQAYANIAMAKKDLNKAAEINEELAKRYEELAEEYKKAGDEKEANICILNSKRAYSNVAIAKRDWNKFAEINEELAEDYKKAGNEKDANICILNSKIAYANIAMVKKDSNKAAEINEELTKRYEELAEEYKKAGNEKEANICILNSKRAYNNAVWEEAKKQPTIEKWNELAKRYEELAEKYKKADKEIEANICILNSKIAYANVAMEKEDWNKFAEINEELAEKYKKAGNEKEANIYILNSKQAYINVAWKETEKQPTIEKWNELAKRYEELAEDYKKAGNEKDANICILNFKRAYAYAALKKATKESTAENWNEASKCYSEVAKAYEKIAVGESDGNKAASYKTVAKECMKKANEHKQYAQ